ncbi:glycosyltransferase involved in cell wall biosynthesis [Weissella uvarum]|uniref:glycosyltransferase n=1 Tax=Weissella uvarum TaxID=1479233 RepID=UPI00195F7C41|nr:glycosyltransferase [Weissella uvarum]MBM7617965.1 glycosyltransferase involved in cell wall biosynthesis [Weissella uvarum]MCM0596184.1 glycosyltransferase [Weissella uvarum]
MSENYKFKLSIIVAIYNIEHEIKDLLKQLEEVRKLPEVEILLLDDGSKDNTPIVLDQLRQSDNFQVLHLENSGLSGVRNHGIILSRGEYLWFVDGDDLIDPYLVKNEINLITENKIDFLQFRYERFDQPQDIQFDPANANVEHVERVSSDEWLERLNDFRNMQYENYAWDHIVKKSVYVDNQITFPLNRNYEDIATTYQLVNAVGQITVIDNVGYFYRNRSGSITNTHSQKNIDDMLRAVDEFQKKENLSFSDENKQNFVHKNLVGAYYMAIKLPKLEKKRIKEYVTQHILANDLHVLRNKYKFEYLLFKFNIYDLYSKCVKFAKKMIGRGSDD